MAKRNYWATIQPNHCYHIYNHAVGTENLFKQSKNYTFFLKKWEKYISPYFANYAFCLMPNHFHFLSKAKPLTDDLKKQIELGGTKRGLKFLSGEVPINVFYESQFASLFKSYSQAINKQEANRYGSLFKAKFRRTLVTDLKDFLYFLCYVHHNPIHHERGLSYLDWGHSSYHYYLMSEINKEKQSNNSIELDKCFNVSLALQSVLKIFKTKEDPSGLEGFKLEHRRFKENFGKE